MNGLQKNLDVLRKEWNMVRADFKRNIARLKKPSLDGSISFLTSLWPLYRRFSACGER